MAAGDQDPAELAPSIPSGVVSLQGQFVSVSPGLAGALGVSEGELMGLGPLAVTHPADRDRLTAMLGLMRAGSIGKAKFRQRWLPAGGGVVEGLVSGSVIHGEDGAPAGFAFAVEISSPIGRQPDWENLFERTHQGIAVIGPDGCHTRVNHAYAAVLAAVPSDLRGLPWLEIVPADCVAELERAHGEMLRNGCARLETLAIRRDGSCFEAEIELVLGDPTDAGTSGHLCLMRDVGTDQASTGGAERRRVGYDGITGLPDITRFVDRVEEAISGAGPSSVAVLVLGVETEQPRTAQPGRISQADVLRRTAERLTANIESNRFVARLGDWSFGILLVGGDELTLTARARCLLKATSHPIVASGETHAIHATLGIAVGDGGDDARELVDEADRARQRARELGAGRFEFSQLGDHRPESPVQQLLDDIRRAMPREELRLRYQPMLDPVDRSVCGVEVLVRWEHPSRTVLAPEIFLPAARRSGAIVSIGRWVLEQSLEQLERWNQELERAQPLRLFINFSSPELAEPSLADVVGATLERTRISPEQLAVDVSDAALIDVHGPAWRSVAALRELGATIVLDRFGTTFSSLADLERLPVDVVKLDRSRVAGLHDDARDRGTLKALTGVAEARGLAVIACGVETERQVEALVGSGCRAAQGFLFAEPRAARAVTKLLSSRSERAGGAPP